MHTPHVRTWSGNNTVRLAAVADRWAGLRRHQPAWQRETWAECVIAHIVCDWRVAPRPLRMACSSGSGSARRGCQRLERETYLPGLRSGASAWLARASARTGRALVCVHGKCCDSFAVLAVETTGGS
jgi:hypothetical protein